MLSFYEIQEQVCAKYDYVIGDLLETEELATLKQIKNAINQSAELFYHNKIDWMKQDGYISFMTKYNTGTLTTTNGLAVITGDGTVWTRDMAGQKIIITDGTDGAVVYRIKSFSSVTGLTLMTKYIHTGGASLSYVIYYDTFDLPPDFKTFEVMKNIDPQKTDFDEDQNLLSSSTTTGFPRQYKLLGARKDSYYDTGTISIAAAGIIVTGVDVVWDDYIIGKYIQLGNYGRLYEITARGTELILTIDKAFGGVAVVAGNYKIQPPGIYQVRFQAAPETAKIIPYTYWPKHIRLTEDNDISPIPSETLLVFGGIWLYGKDRDHPAAANAKTDFETEAARLGMEKMAEYQENAEPVFA